MNYGPMKKKMNSLPGGVSVVDGGLISQIQDQQIEVGRTNQNYVIRFLLSLEADTVRLCILVRNNMKNECLHSSPNFTEIVYF